MVLLDLSSAFDTVDHEILFRRLEVSYDLQGSSLSWSTSYLNVCMWFIHCRASRSNHTLLGCGVTKVLSSGQSCLYSTRLTSCGSLIILACTRTSTLMTVRCTALLLHWQRSGVAAVKQTPAQCSQDWVFMQFVGSTIGSGPVHLDSRWDWFV